jgi:hypothetical protein
MFEYFDWYSSSNYLLWVLDATKRSGTQPFSWLITRRTICLNILINFHLPTIYHNCLCHKAQKNLASFLALHFHSDAFPFKLEIGWKLGESSYFQSPCTLWMSLFFVLNIVLACFVVYLIISFHFHSQRLNSKLWRISSTSIEQHNFLISWSQPTTSPNLSQGPNELDLASWVAVALIAFQ